MNLSWHPDDAPDRPKLTIFNYALAVLRGTILIAVLLTGLAFLLLLRLVERPIWGLHRPWTPYITQTVCRISLVILGVRLRISGTPMAHPGALVANHSSWVDIFALNAVSRLYFVSKAEVAKWPGIGWLARATGTLFIERKRQDAKIHGTLIENRLKAGHRLLFFPEGTSSDGSVILPFKSTLFAPFMNRMPSATIYLQPVRIDYRAPATQDHRFYGWWGDMTFGPHVTKLLAIARRGRVDVRFLPTIDVSGFTDRKSLAMACENSVRKAGSVKDNP